MRQFGDYRSPAILTGDVPNVPEFAALAIAVPSDDIDAQLSIRRMGLTCRIKLDKIRREIPNSEFAWRVLVTDSPRIDEDTIWHDAGHTSGNYCRFVEAVSNLARAENELWGGRK